MKRPTTTQEAPLIEASNVSLSTGQDRPLFSGLNMSLGRERVALIGRNGVGKSTLLSVLMRDTTPDSGNVVLRTQPRIVPQTLHPMDTAAILLELQALSPSSRELVAECLAAGLRTPEQLPAGSMVSPGELRKLLLLREKLATPDLLLLDEPTQDLDERGVSWLRGWLADWSGGMIVASHDLRLLRDFAHFFIVAETGCRLFFGTFAELEVEMEREHAENERRYVRNLNRLVEQEERTIHIARRRARKRQYGRVSELGRATPRMRLNQKRDYAQVKHGRMKRIREERLNAAREWTKATRRALNVNLQLVLPVPTLPPPTQQAIIELDDVSAVAGGRCLFDHIDVHQLRERLAVTGPNGAGKTTLLEIMLGRRTPASGFAHVDHSRLSTIAQGGTDWMLEESLVSKLSLQSAATRDSVAAVLVAHKFPLALAERPLKSLSPGERVRAALICLFQMSPAVELLVLDEPTYSLDLIGQKALTQAMKAWPGGLVVASHHEEFLSDIGIESQIKLE